MLTTEDVEKRISLIRIEIDDHEKYMRCRELEHRATGANPFTAQEIAHCLHKQTRLTSELAAIEGIKTALEEGREALH